MAQRSVEPPRRTQTRYNAHSWRPLLHRLTSEERSASLGQSCWSQCVHSLKVPLNRDMIWKVEFVFSQSYSINSSVCLYLPLPILQPFMRYILANEICTAWLFDKQHQAIACWGWLYFTCRVLVQSSHFTCTAIVATCVMCDYYPQFMFATNAATILGGTLVGQEVEMRTMATVIYGFVMTVSWQSSPLFHFRTPFVVFFTESAKKTVKVFHIIMLLSRYYCLCVKICKKMPKHLADICLAQPKTKFVFSYINTLHVFIYYLHATIPTKCIIGSQDT